MTHTQNQGKTADIPWKHSKKVRLRKLITHGVWAKRENLLRAIRDRKMWRPMIPVYTETTRHIDEEEGLLNEVCLFVF